MAITPRTLLTLRAKTGLTKEEFWLRDAYANIVSNLVESTITKSSEFDPFSEFFYGLGSVKSNKDLYRAMLEVTSYFWASKGGKGKVLEKIIASAAGEEAAVGLSLSEIPDHIETSRRLMTKSKEGEVPVLLVDDDSQSWEAIRAATGGIGFDLLNIVDDTLILLELKNRVDSGGTAARREAIRDKFFALCKLVDEDEKLFKNDSKDFDFVKTLRCFGITKVEMLLGLLYNIDGSEATIDGDRKDGFYSTSKNLLTKYASKNKFVTVTINDKVLCGSFEKGGITFNISMAYGSDVTRKFTAKHLSLTETLSNIMTGKWDDIWLALSLAVSQREMLLRHGENHIRQIKKLHDDADDEFLMLFQKFRDEPTNSVLLTQIVMLLRKRLDFSKGSVTNEVEGHLSDCLYLFASYVSNPIS